MDVLTYSDTRSHLKSVMDRVVENHAPVIVTRQNREPVVIVAHADWEALHETLHLLSTRANAESLFASIAELDAGQGVQRDPIDA